MKKCPVCEKYTFTEVGIYDDCPVCGWTDDIYQEHFPDKTGANVVSFNKAKENYSPPVKIKLYDTVLLKNGYKDQIVDLLDRKAFLADVETDE